MAGHSKWANIQHRKKSQDAKRGKLFTRLIREITVGARMGGAELDSNPRLRLAVDKGLGANMPKDTIERAIKRGAGAGEGDSYEEIRYEGYGPGGIAVMVDCMTDNRNRTVAEVRHAFSKCNGNLGAEGSVAYMFNHQGVISFGPDVDEDSIMEVALEHGAEDIVSHADGSIEVLTSAEDYAQVKDALTASDLVAAEAEITMHPENQTAVDADTARKCLKLLDMLEDLDDTQAVYNNGEFPSEAYES